MNEEKTCETCRFYCVGSDQCVMKVWDNGQQYQMDPQQICALYERAS